MCGSQSKQDSRTSSRIKDLQEHEMNDDTHLISAEVDISETESRSFEYAIEIGREKTEVVVKLDNGQMINSFYWPNDLDLSGDRGRSIAKDIARLNYGALDDPASEGETQD